MTSTPPVEVATSVVVLGVLAALWVIVGTFPQESATYPRFVIACGVLAGTGMLVRSSWRWVRGGSRAGRPGWTEARQAGQPRKVLAYAGLAVIYLAAMPFVGYIVATTCFLAVTMCSVTGWRVRTLAAILTGVLATVALARFALGLSMPGGVLF